MSDVMQICKTIFDGTWALFKGVTIPGLGISAAKFFIAFLVIRWSLNLLSLATGFRTNAGGVAQGYRRSSESLNHYRMQQEKKMKSNP